MNMQSLPSSTEAPFSAYMASPSGAFSSVIAHGHHSISPLSIAHSLNNGIRCPELTSCSEVPEQHEYGNYPGLPPQLAPYTGPPIGGQNNDVIHSVQGQQIHGSAGAPNEPDDGDEWSRYLEIRTPDDTTAPDITPDCHQMAGLVPGSSAPNFETWHHTVPQSVSIPSDPQQLYVSISSPAATNGHSPKRTRTRMRWTVEMHDRFIDAVNQLGGIEDAKPKKILEIMNVEGLTRDQVKSHLQKYKSAQVRHQSSEGQLTKTGTSVEITTSNEVVPSNVQMSFEALALQVQMELQKKLHEMVEKTHHDLLEIQRSLLVKHVMNLHELENRRKPSTGRTAPLPACGARGNHGVGSAAPASDVDGHAPEGGSHGDHAGA